MVNSLRMYCIKIAVCGILCIGIGLFVLADGPNVFWQFLGLCLAACGFFLLIGGYAHVRGITIQQLNDLEVRCVKERKV